MKKLFYLVVAVLGAATTGCTHSTKVSVENCKCLICEACDSLDSVCHSYTADSITDIHGKKWPVYLGHKDFDMWYDSLTTLVVEDIQYHYDTEISTAAFDSYIREEYLGNPKFMHELEEGFDGLCGDCYDTHSEAIDEFYNVVNK